jgi:hypothetical protein
VDCSPDLRSARVEVSVFGETVEKREAFIWLVNNAKVRSFSLFGPIELGGYLFVCAWMVGGQFG